MKVSILAITLMCTAVRHVLSHKCVCSDHETRSVFPCMHELLPFSGELRNDMYDENCMPEALDVVAKNGWFAGIFYGGVVYIKVDSLVTKKDCPLTKPAAGITFEKTCPPIMKPGTSLNPTPPPPPTTPTTTPTPATIKPTTAKPTTKTTTARPTPTTSTTLPPTTTTTAPATSQLPPSQKCDFLKLANHLVHQTSASHPNARQCPDGTNTHTEALILETCRNPNLAYSQWKQELKVIDNCYNIPKGEPLSAFVGGHPIGVMALFYKCTSSVSYKVAFQSCGSKLQLVDVTKTSTFPLELFYTVSL